MTDESTSPFFCFVVVPERDPGDRIVGIRWFEPGFYTTSLDLPEMTRYEAEMRADSLNRRLGIPEDVVEAALKGSLFGWETKSAEVARLFAMRHHGQT